eukprot:TRINITY_DN6711_c0_g1_i1.p1 TRINITY_DN6711_c0_g1~~TRINITY_DN6711_c0_g1_i1.p1  ORF type:complete len:329 (+),score=34.01 TRINITY_DN6711_c0_g1_i1:118-1104(+)
MQLRNGGYPEHKPRVKMCRNWERNGECRFGVGCWFEHGSREQRQVNSMRSQQLHYHPPPQDMYGAPDAAKQGLVPPAAQQPPHMYYIPPHMESAPPPPAHPPHPHPHPHPQRSWGGVPPNAHNPYEQPPGMYAPPPPPILSLVQYPYVAPPPHHQMPHEDYAMPPPQHIEDDDMWGHRVYPHICYERQTNNTPRDTGGIPEGLFRSDGEVTDDYEILLELDKHKVQVGVSDMQLELEMQKVPAGDPILHGEMCTICHDKYNETPKEPVSRLPCTHLYHTHCIKTWLSCNTRCPVCNWDSWTGGKTIVCTTPSESYDDYYLEYEEDDEW